jgi:hypothetical protein
MHVTVLKLVYIHNVLLQFSAYHVAIFSTVKYEFDILLTVYHYVLQ